MNPSSQGDEWRAESIPDEYLADEPIVYSVATTDLSKPTFWFRDEEEATRLAAYLTALERENAALRAAIDSLRTAEGEAMLVLESTEYKLEQSESRAKAAEEERDRLRAALRDIASNPNVNVLGMDIARKVLAEQEVKPTRLCEEVDPNDPQAGRCSLPFRHEGFCSWSNYWTSGQGVKP